VLCGLKSVILLTRCLLIYGKQVIVCATLNTAKRAYISDTICVWMGAAI